MDVSQLANTFLLLNLKDSNINWYNVCLLLSFIYFTKYYYEILKQTQHYYFNYIYKKRTITLELKTNPDRSIMNQIYSNKVLGILYYLTNIDLNITAYEELSLPVQLNSNEEFANDINISHLIPKIKNFLLKDDLYITTSIENVDFKSKGKKRQWDDNDDTYEEVDANKAKDYKVIKITLSCYRSTIDHLKSFVTECELEYLKFINRDNEKKYIFTTSKESEVRECSKITVFHQYPFSCSKTFNNLFFEQKSSIIERINNYTNNIFRYKELGIAHTLGFLFYGAPGTGKTSTIKAIANHMNRSLITINMKDITNINELYKLFNKNCSIAGREIKNNKRIYVFEEIDCHDCFLSRELKEEKIDRDEAKSDLAEVLSCVVTDPRKKSFDKKEKLTVGQILELLDGIIESDDRVCIFTTNHLEKIDKALLRPGRIDMIVEFKSLRRNDIQNYFQLWYKEKINEKDLQNIKDYVITQAEFGKLCFENMNNPKRVIKELQKL